MKKSFENAVALMGVVATETIRIHDVYGQQYDGWATMVETERKSGAADVAVVVMPEDTDISGMEIGVPVMIIGKIQTFKDFSTGKVLVYVLAEYAAPVEGEYWENQNDVVLTGRLGKRIIYRETPKGKRITDITVEVPNVIKGKSCYIPCICWQQVADEVKDWKEGTEVVITGRFQSRNYIKRLDENTEEERICYEVSVYTIRKARKEKEENEV